MKFEKKSSELSESERFAKGTIDSLPLSWLIMVTLCTIFHGHGIKILARLASNFPWTMARVPWLRTLGSIYLYFGSAKSATFGYQ